MKNLYTLRKYFVRYKKKLLFGFIFIFLSNIGTVYVPLLMKDSIDALQSQEEQVKVLNELTDTLQVHSTDEPALQDSISSIRSEISEINNTAGDLLLKYALMIVGASLFAGIFRFLIRQTIIVVSREIEYDLRGDFWKHIQKLPLRYFQNTATGNIMAHATNDINAVRMFIGPSVMYSIDTSVRLIMVLILMLSLNTSLTIYALLPLPLLSVLVYKVGKLIHSKFTVIQEKFAQLTTLAQENFSGIRVIKSYVREESEMKRYAEHSQDYLKKNMNLVRTQALIMPILFLITGLSIIVVIWLGGTKVINGELTLGEITAFIVYLGILIWPMIAFGWVINIIQQAEASMKRLNKIFSEPYEITETENTNYSIKNINGDIEFRNVSFRYNENSPYILKNVNLKISAGSTLAIMGYTGSGKTSLINLIPRLYECSEGEVLIDGINVKELPLDILRTNIGVVQQESFLFSDTVLNNISYGRREVDKSVVNQVAAIAQFDKDVQEFPLKYETIVGERGITFSGGQKQRSCLARALAIDPKILILDDSFSAVDTSTEEEILRNLKSFMKVRTSIIISHRISTVKDADKIIIFAESKIAEEGTHEELVAKGGIYADLHYKQLLEQELEEIR
ncbi:MAG: ABC transporter ATP-binding protein/permease [Ignavibacteria bacterium]|nr:ABC transporter ATP-binding protein/permease [Ignavibacteria bacterium]